MVRYWFKYAARNLRAAKHILDLGTEYKTISGFHSQQCAEMAIKGFLAFHKVRIPKIHDVERLSAEVRKVDPKLARIAARARKLTDLAVAYRYPEAEIRPLTVARTKQAIKLAEKILNECISRCKPQ